VNVWVVFSVGERVTRGRDPTVPLQGGPMSIFAPQATRAETIFECVGAFTSAEAAVGCSDRHRAAHPADRVKIKVAQLDAPAAGAAAAPANVCTECGRPSLGGMCQPCQAALWARSRANDPELLEELEAAK
jgi:hypothetical protein